MKKIIASYLVCIVIGFSMLNVFAYGSSANVTLNTNVSSAKSSDIGYDYSATAYAKNNASSGAWMESAIWSSYKGAMWPFTKEKSTDLKWGAYGTITDSQSMTSVYRQVLTRAADNHVSGSGNIRLGSE